MPDRYRLAPGTVWVDGAEAEEPDAVAWVVHVPDGIPLALEGPAWLLWVALAESADGDTLEGIVGRVERLLGLEADRAVKGDVKADVKGDVERFLDELVDAGLVVSAGPPDPQPPDPTSSRHFHTDQGDHSTGAGFGTQD